MLRAWLLAGLVVASESFVPSVPSSNAASIRYQGAATFNLNFGRRNVAHVLKVGVRPNDEHLLHFDLRTPQGQLAAEKARADDRAAQDAARGSEEDVYRLMKEKCHELSSNNNFIGKDNDASGDLDFHEFAAAFGPLAQPSSMGRYSNVLALRRVFDELDVDGDGMVSRDALNRM